MIDQRPKTKDQRSNLKLDLSSLVFGPWSCLVVGYGNDLRGDDGAGPRVAGLVRDWNLPGLIAVSTRQLTPELAEALAQAQLAIFVDARPPDGTSDVRVEPVAPVPGHGALGHTGDPAALLELAQALYAARPAAWLLTLPSISFELGADLSAVAARGVADALSLIRAAFARHDPFEWL
jgi:hydrogenase maturation protease